MMCSILNTLFLACSYAAARKPACGMNYKNPAITRHMCNAKGILRLQGSDAVSELESMVMLYKYEASDISLERG